jgi:hypothetical protein
MIREVQLSGYKAGILDKKLALQNISMMHFSTNPVISLAYPTQGLRHSSQNVVQKLDHFKITRI